MSLRYARGVATLPPPSNMPRRSAVVPPFAAWEAAAEGEGIDWVVNRQSLQNLYTVLWVVFSRKRPPPGADS